MVQKFAMDEMTPKERREAMEAGRSYDRFPCLPCMGEFKTRVSRISVWEMWHDAQKMAGTELAAFQRFGHDQLMIGPNSYGISEMLGADVQYPKDQLPYIGHPVLDDYEMLESMEPVDPLRHPRMQVFREAAAILEKEALPVVPVVASVGGPFTIASYLRGAEFLLRDCRRNPEGVHRLLRLITDSEKNCIRVMAEFGLGTAFADPVANPELLGPRYYKEFAFPYMKELTDYAYQVTGKKPFLHMCGKTYQIWKYFREYQLGALSLDNIIDLERARDELSDVVTIAGNVPPVDVILNGTKEEIFESVRACLAVGKQMKQGYVLATGCEIPFGTDPVKADWFMEAGRQGGTGDF